MRKPNVMDKIDKARRSKNMANIKDKNTKPELFVRSLIHKSGFRYLVSPGKIPGKPDMYFSKKKAAIFIHGCFWHKHEDCKYSTIPKSNIEFWANKFESNVRRDHNVICLLNNDGIFCMIIWECTIKSMQKNKELEKIYQSRIIDWLEDDNRRNTVL